MDRVKRLSLEILEDHKNKFGTNFEENKKALENLAVIRSKELKNEIAGFITKFIKHEILDKKKQEERIAKQAKLEEELKDENLDRSESQTESTQTETFSVEEKPQIS